MSLTDVKIPKENLLGEIGNGLRVAFGSLDNGRIGIAALSVGIAQSALEEAVNYSKDRVAFGKPISEFQAIQHKLADMTTEIEAARLLTLRAAAAKDSGDKNPGFTLRWRNFSRRKRQIGFVPKPSRFTAVTDFPGIIMSKNITATLASRRFTKARARCRESSFHAEF